MVRGALGPRPAAFERPRCGAAGPGGRREPAPAERRHEMTTRIIDVHAHLGPWLFRPDRGSAADSLRSMDAHGIDTQLVSGVEAVTYDALSGHPALAAAITGHERLRGMFVIDPRFLQAAEAQLDELLPSRLFLGAKIHTDYAATPAGSPRMADALRLCAARQLPALVHSWGTQLREHRGPIGRAHV